MDATATTTLLTAKDVAAKLQCSTVKAYKLMQAGKIKTIRLGKLVRVYPADFEQFINEQRQLPGAS